MQYHAREFCYITGLKPDTLRFYVDKGLIVPTVDPENQYKLYCDKDVVDMYFARSRRAMGTPIVQINEVLTRLSLEEQLQWYSAHERQLTDEIEQLQWQLQRCRKAQRDIQNIPRLLYRIIDQSSCEGPDLYQIHLIGPNALEGEEKYDLAEQWREIYPHMLSMIHIPLEELTNPDCSKYSVTFGVVVPAFVLQGFPELTKKPAYLFPSQDCIGMIIRLQDPFMVTREDIQPLLDYADEKKYKFISDMTSWLISRTMENGIAYYYFAIRVSVDKSGSADTNH